MKTAAIGADIGGTKLHFAVVDKEGRVIRESKRPSPSREGGGVMMAAVISGIAEMEQWIRERNGEWSCSGIGIGSAGQIHYKTGKVEFAVDTIKGWTGMMIKDAVADRFPYPVFVDNDVNAVAIAEKLYGAGRLFGSFVCIALGTGVGGAIVESGKLVRGAYGGAGELGHITVDYKGPRCSCGNYGCLELYASGTGIARLAKERIEREGWSVGWRPDSREVIAAWLRGDERASEVMVDVVSALSSGISGLIHALNPEAVIIGGGVAETGKPLFDAIAKETARRTGSAMWRATKLLPAEAGKNAGVVGAAAQAWLNEPE